MLIIPSSLFFLQIPAAIGRPVPEESADADDAADATGAV